MRCARIQSSYAVGVSHRASPDALMGSAGFAMSAKVASLFDEPAPALASDLLLFGGQVAHGRELLLPLERAARVDDESRVEALLVRMDRRIQRAAPGALDEVDRPLGV